MKKAWIDPEIGELNINGTEYRPKGGTKTDGFYQSFDGEFVIPTKGYSGQNEGKPNVDVN